ncbi:MAG: hypothetical protein M1812_001813 [Candelaria pacifica]|nr:MAG: hypothetical protein M1812_001813 [Candelaria pacifica]
MPTFWEIVIEKCAGRGLSDKLRQRLFMQRYLSTIITPQSSPPSESPSRSEKLKAGKSRRLPAVPLTGDCAPLPQNSRPRRPSALVNQVAQGPSSHHTQRSCISFEITTSDEDAIGDSTPKDSGESNERPCSPSSESDSKSKESATGRTSFLYPVPRMPEMVGHGRFRHSKTATAEWAEKNLRKFDATSLNLTEGFEILQHNRQPFIIRKGSDVTSAMCITVQNECDVDPTIGSFTTRGFTSPSSVSTDETIKPKKTGLSEEGGLWQAETGHQGGRIDSHQGSNNGTHRALEANTGAAATEIPTLLKKLNRNPQNSILSAALQELVQQLPTTDVTSTQSFTRQEDILRVLRAGNGLQVQEAALDCGDNNNENINNKNVTENDRKQTQKKETSGKVAIINAQKRAPVEKRRRCSSGFRKQQLRLFDQARQESRSKIQPAEIKFAMPV